VTASGRCCATPSAELTLTLAVSQPGREDQIVAESNPNHACPYCDLMFLYHSEVKDHILHDHPEHAAVVDSIDPHELPHN
jgi:hypothetical protein